MLLLCLLFQAWVAEADEYIKHFHSQIEVKTNGDILVTETITVQAEHEQIKRGIYRDFPTIYQTALLTKSTVGFEVTEVLRNGQAEPYHTENMSNGVRVYIGQRGRTVSRGEHVYRLSYRTDRQIAFLDDFDRFAWNVTGNDWRFPMELVTAEVRLPDGVSMSMVNTGVWTGFAGETSAAFTSEVNGNVISIRSTEMLQAYQGLTFSLEIPKGFIQDQSNGLLDFFADNMLWVLMVLTLLALIMFYLLAWNQVGRDPEQGVIMPLFYPPKDVSPAAMRYILEEQSDHKNFTAALINLAVKGYIELKKVTDGYRISKVKSSGQSLRPKSSGESIIMRRLFGGGRSQVTIDKKYDAKIQTAIKQVSKRLKTEYQSKCFKDNRMLGYFGIGISLVVLVFFMLHLNLFNIDVLSLMLVPAAITGFSLFMVYKSNRGLWNSLVSLFHGAVMLVIFINSAGGIPMELVAMSIFLVAVNGIFIYLLKSPTPFGRELMDKIEGFKLYLSTAEQHRLDIMHPPEMTPDLFEEYLPYAMALGVENQWSERFANHLQSAGTEPGEYHYTPDWYSGGRFNLSSSSGGFSDMSRGMASTISAAAVPPSSSGSGFSSGGGFSGGGGGGGGGGGW